METYIDIVRIKLTKNGSQNALKMVPKAIFDVFLEKTKEIEEFKITGYIHSIYKVE